MPITRYKLSCDTTRDLDIIEFLDSFPAEERRIVIKVALREYMEKEIMGAQEITSSSVQLPTDIYDLLVSIDKGMNGLAREVSEMKRKSLFAIQSNSDIINNDTEISDQDKREIESNIENLFKD